MSILLPLLSPLVQNTTNSIAAIEGGQPLSRSPLAAHALSSLSWLTRGMEFAEFSAWLLLAAVVDW